MQPQVLRLRGSQSAVRHFAQDDKVVVDLERRTTTAKALWLGDGRGREADFSTALRTMRLCAASVEMTVLGCWESVQTTAKAKALGLVEFL